MNGKKLTKLTYENENNDGKKIIVHNSSHVHSRNSEQTQQSGKHRDRYRCINRKYYTYAQVVFQRWNDREAEVEVEVEKFGSKKAEANNYIQTIMVE